MKIQYNPKLKGLSQKLRKNSTLSEILLWHHLKGKQMMNYDFHRQKPISEYIVDFCCVKLKLIIEIDGASHENTGNKDILRENKLRKLGFHVLRFDDLEIKNNLSEVVEGIYNWIEENASS